MFYDSKYRDNVILRREAFQNLLTNIKNYPIIDVDFVEEFEKDILHKNNIWRDFTHNTPCLKITYGDESTNKGNSMFASTEQKRVLYNNQQTLNRLKIQLNNKKYEEAKLKIALANNQNFLEQEKKQLERIKEKMNTLTKNKEVYLQTGLSIMYFPFLEAGSTNEPLNIDEIWYPDYNAGILSKVNLDFGYNDFLIEYNEDYSNLKDIPQTITLTYSVIHYHMDRVKLQLISIRDMYTFVGDNSTKVYVFTEEERNFINHFIDFIGKYNYLSFTEALTTAGFTSEEIRQFQDANYVQHKVSTESLERIRAKFAEIIEDIKNNKWDWEDNTYPDFSVLVQNYKQNIESITQKIIGNEDNEGIISSNIRRINERLNKLIGTAENSNEDYIQISLTQDEYLPNLYYINTNEGYVLDTSNDYNSSKIYYTVNGSIKYYEAQIKIVEQIIKNCNEEIILTSHQGDKTVYGYKYIKLGTNINFGHNFGSYNSLSLSLQEINNEEKEITFKNNSKLNQLSGTFKININDQQIEVPIKGFNGESSNKDIFIKTETLDNNGQKSGLGNIYFLGNVFGKGNIVTNTGHIYASQGSVAAAGFLAMRSSVGTLDSTCGFRYNGGKKVIETYDITGNTIKEYPTNVNDYEHILELPSVDDGQIYIHPSHVNVNEQTIDSIDENRLTWQEAIEYETDNGTTDWYCTSVKSSAPFTKFSTQQIYLSNGNKFATLKINSSDNSIEIYNADSDYNDGGLVGLKAANTSITGNLTVSNTIRTNNLYLNNNNVTSNIPSTNGTSEQLWIGGTPHWGNTLTGDLILSNAAGADENVIPDNSEATDEGGAVFRCAGAGYFGLNLSAKKVFNAVYNDYAEYRRTINLEPGRVVIDNDDGSLSCANERLQPGAQVISDTFGHAMGFANDYQTPLAVAGRVLVYTYQDRSKYHAGMAVCSAPGGTVDVMSREEIKEYPDCIIGIVSEIPKYDTWGSDNIKVNDRIWIKIK